MVRKNVYAKPSDVTAEQGVVNLDGPDGVDVGLTPEAALETSERLFDGATQAAGQGHRIGREDEGEGDLSPPGHMTGKH